MTDSTSPRSPSHPSDLDAFRARVRDWIERNRPATPAFTLPQSFLEVESREQFEFLREWQHALYRAGLLGFDVPREYGGQGVDPARQRIVQQELGRAEAPFLVNVIALQWVAPTILAYGTEQQKQRYLGRLLSAEDIWCQGFSEPGAGSDLASLETRAVRADGGWRVTGHKVWTTLAHFAQHMILLARTGPPAGAAGSSKYAGLSYFLFPMDAGGVTVQPLVKMTREGGFNQVIFDDAFMPEACLLGAEGQGWKIAMTTLAFERGAAGSSERDRAAQDAALLGKLIALVQRCTHAGQSRAADASVRERLASLWIDLEALRLGGMRARAPGLVADRPQALAMAHKLVFSEWGQRLYRLACEVLGPDASLWMGDPDAPDGAEWPRGYMNSYGFTIGGGTSEIQRNILGERVLGLPKSK